ncbi:unnamed protein product [Paramecium octaurelia]|uniref:Uncharacterized protein n=1 Tax=Paramecium octaurelia TaxID=43137 RepID=A0A8S1YMQ5_PAROT|nr:unnamed protein product [Paramecium octaurelia]
MSKIKEKESENDDAFGLYLKSQELKILIELKNQFQKIIKL